MTTNSCDLEKERNSVSECSEAERESEWTHERYVETLQQFIVYPPEKAQEYLECLLFSEIGEVVGVHAKYVRGDFDETEYKKRLIGELGDVLFAGSLLFDKPMLYRSLFNVWVEELHQYRVESPLEEARCALYCFVGDDVGRWSASEVALFIATLAKSIGITIEELREANVKKLQSRKERGKIKGDGDER
jgi:NTP pyrophosphatase (non-canonical NTP hydrolase)